MSTLLLVDDDQDLVSLLSFALRREGFNPLEAFDSTRALELVRSGEPRLVLLDVNLDARDGFEVLRELRLCAAMSRSSC